MPLGTQIDCPEKRQAILKLVSDNPRVSSRALARIALTKFKGWFASFEAARSSIRSYRGAIGRARSKAKAKARGIFQDRRDFKWTMPESIAAPWEPFMLPDGRTLAFGDTHIPHHNDNAIAALVAHGDKMNDGKGPNNVLLNGDVADFFSISRWEADPRKRDLAGEIMAVRSFLGYLRQRWPKARIIYKFGNHDERWEHFLWNKAPELLNLPQLRLESILTDALTERMVDDAASPLDGQPAIPGIEFVKDKRIIRASHLGIIHGHELAKGSNPVNPARGNFLKAIECCLGSHLHKESSHTATTMFGRVISGWSMGCLCDMHPQYLPINQWSQSFCEIHLAGDDWSLKPFKIVKGKVHG
jgi:hypothetical protein